jgi:hypothetical protein
MLCPPLVGWQVGDLSTSYVAASALGSPMRARDTSGMPNPSFQSYTRASMAVVCLALRGPADPGGRQRGVRGALPALPRRAQQPALPDVAAGPAGQHPRRPRGPHPRKPHAPRVGPRRSPTTTGLTHTRRPVRVPALYRIPQFAVHPDFYCGLTRRTRRERRTDQASVFLRVLRSLRVQPSSELECTIKPGIWYSLFSSHAAKLFSVTTS